jgi:hypothetical protein
MDTSDKIKSFFNSHHNAYLICQKNDDMKFHCQMKEGCQSKNLKNIMDDSQYPIVMTPHELENLLSEKFKSEQIYINGKKQYHSRLNGVEIYSFGDDSCNEIHVTQK